ncbi:MAG: serpin family protein [Candidatus Zixiibacteriota bacterium]
MKKLFVYLIIICAGIICLQCSKIIEPFNTNVTTGSDNNNPGLDPEYPDPGSDRTPGQFTLAEKGMVGSINSFGLKLFKKINNASANNKNLFISPLSVSYALGMAYNGAGGETKEAMASTLELPELSPIDINLCYKNMTQILGNLDEYVTFNIANSIWYRNGFPVKQSFLDINRQYFLATVRALDFNDPSSADTINTWVDINTNGKITNIINPPIDPLTMMYLINAIYFKGGWSLPFDPEFSFDMDFTREDGSDVPRTFMRADTSFNYTENDLFQAIELMYGDSAFSIVIILPLPEYTVNDIIAQLDTDAWAQWVSQLEDQTVYLKLPKFKFKYEIRPKQILAEMGMNIAFQPYAADFTPIADINDLHISDIIHKTFVQLDEEGTEAAAVTVVAFGVTSIDPTPYMTINRPFLFAIRERVSGTILFIGKVADPVWE